MNMDDSVGYLQKMGARVRADLAELGLTGTPSYLLGYPNHSNSGDSAIWLGERTVLDELGVDLLGIASALRTTTGMLRSDATLLFHGGGNVGDLWPDNNSWRQGIIGTCLDQRIVILPQSVDFRSDESAQEASRIMGRHPDLLVLARDSRSAERAEALGCDVVLTPDVAFGLDNLVREGPTARPVVWHLRTDHEARNDPSRSLVASDDWIPSPEFARGSSLWFMSALFERLPMARRYRDLRIRLADEMARIRVARAIKLLSGGERVVTDRLHGHILCSMLHIPHIVIEDEGGKISAFTSTWPGDPTLLASVRTVADAAEALGMPFPPKTGTEAW